ncbi:hypothetical protein [Spirosoma lituiforme]
MESETRLPFVGHEFEVVRYRHEDQSKLLQLMAQVDLQLFSGFLTVQLAFGSFLVQQDLYNNYVRFGLISVNLSLASICFILLRNNYKRRKEVVATLKNCNEALGLNQQGAFIPGKSINSDTKFRPWFHWYSIAILLSFTGICLILFSPKKTEQKAANAEPVRTQIIDNRQ